MGRSGMGCLTLGEVRDGSGDPRGGPGRVEGPSGWYGQGRGTLGEVWDELGEHRGGPGRVGRPSRRFGTGGAKIEKVRDKLGDPQEAWHGLETLGEVGASLGTLL